jgi:hypothetical protein
MDMMKKVVGRLPVGLWLVMVAILLLLLACGMQAYSLVDWDGAVEMGLQNERLDGSEVDRALANNDRGVALADMVWLLPLCLLSLLGVLMRWESAAVLSFMTLSIGVYFPLIFTFQRWESHPETAIAALVMWTIPSTIGIIGLWSNRGFFGTTEG